MGLFRTLNLGCGCLQSFTQTLLISRVVWFSVSTETDTRSQNVKETSLNKVKGKLKVGLR